MEFLSQNNIEYEDRDITQNDAWLNELVGMGYMATPVTVINGESVVGFDKFTLNKLIAKHNL